MEEQYIFSNVSLEVRLNFNNNTEFVEYEPSPTVRKLFDVTVIICMLLIMFAMGCEVTLKEVLGHVRKPVGILIGMSCQFLLLPLLGFIAIKALNIEGLHATSILILSCSPGGGYSNLLAYLAKGDVPLSVAMTTISNVFALGMTPLNVWIYSHGIETRNIQIPFVQMVISMVALTVILGAGALLRWKKPKWALYATKTGVAASGVMALACGVLAIVLYPHFFTKIPWFLYAAVAIVAPSGLLVAYLVAWACKLSGAIRRTIAIESAVQNIGTAITIAIISFAPEKLKVMSMYIILYAGFTVFGLLATSGIFWAGNYFLKRGDGNISIAEEKLNSSNKCTQELIFIQSSTDVTKDQKI